MQKSSSIMYFVPLLVNSQIKLSKHFFVYFVLVIGNRRWAGHGSLCDEWIWPVDQTHSYSWEVTSLKKCITQHAFRAVHNIWNWCNILPCSLIMTKLLKVPMKLYTQGANIYCNDTKLISNLTTFEVFALQYFGLEELNWTVLGLQIRLKFYSSLFYVSHVIFIDICSGNNYTDM